MLGSVHIYWTQLIEWLYKPWEYLIPNFLQCKKKKCTLCFVFYGCISCEAYILTNHFRQRRTRREQMALFLQMTLPLGSIVVLAVAVKCIIYPLHNKQSKESVLRLVIALFAPLIGVLFKVASRIFVQRLSF